MTVRNSSTPRNSRRGGKARAAARVWLNRSKTWESHSDIKTLPFQAGARLGAVPLLGLASCGVAQAGEQRNAHGQQAGGDEHGQKGVAGQQIPDLAHQGDDRVHAAHDGAHAAAGDNGRSIAHGLSSFPA